MRGLYAHASERMRSELVAALQQRWEDTLHARAALGPHPFRCSIGATAALPQRNRATHNAATCASAAATGTGR